MHDDVVDGNHGTREAWQNDTGMDCRECTKAHAPLIERRLSERAGTCILSSNIHLRPGLRCIIVPCLGLGVDQDAGAKTHTRDTPPELQETLCKTTHPCEKVYRRAQSCPITVSRVARGKLCKKLFLWIWQDLLQWPCLV